MNIGSIAKIRIPSDLKVNMEEVSLMKEMVKDETFCKMKIVKYQDQFYALKTIVKK